MTIFCVIPHLMRDPALNNPRPDSPRRIGAGVDFVYTLCLYNRQNKDRALALSRPFFDKFNPPTGGERLLWRLKAFLLREKNNLGV